jgi:hypothetical protein
MIAGLFLVAVARLAHGADVPAEEVMKRMARFQKVEMPFTFDGLTAREAKLVRKMIDASRELEQIYWRQNDPQAIELYRKLRLSRNEDDRRLARLIWINGSRFDLLAENEPFASDTPLPKGRNLYPADLTREQVDEYVRLHPDQKAAIYDERTVITRSADGKLKATSYHVAYKPWLQRAAADLREAANYSDDKAFARYLRLRAKALLTDDYFESDVAWVQLDKPKFDLIFAPYETYLDDLLGIKTSYGSAVLIRDDKQSAALEVFQKYVPEIQKALPLDAADLPSKEGKATPMEVMNAPYRAGDLRHGYQAVADNLPNDPRIHEKYGSKKIFFSNFMDARVNKVILPLAKLVMVPEQAARASAEGYLAGVMMHEISHGLGPAFSRVNGKQVDIREAIGAAFSGLEEAKADVVGMYGLQWLIEREVLPRERLSEYYDSYLAGIFRTVRFGTAEAHGKAEMMQFNYYTEQGAIRYDAASGRYAIDEAKMHDAIRALAKELLEQEATGDRARTEAWFAKYGTMPPQLRTALEGATSIPVDIDPVVALETGI